MSACRMILAWGSDVQITVCSVINADSSRVLADIWKQGVQIEVS